MSKYVFFFIYIYIYFVKKKISGVFVKVKKINGVIVFKNYHMVIMPLTNVLMVVQIGIILTETEQQVRTLNGIIYGLANKHFNTQEQIVQDHF